MEESIIRQAGAVDALREAADRFCPPGSMLRATCGAPMLDAKGDDTGKRRNVCGSHLLLAAAEERLRAMRGGEATDEREGEGARGAEQGAGADAAEAPQEDRRPAAAQGPDDEARQYRGPQEEAGP